MDKLNELYYNNNNFVLNHNELYDLAKKNKLNLSHKQIEQFIEKQTINQLYKKPTTKTIYEPIRAFDLIPGTLQIDLVDVSKFSRQNKGVHFILVVIDVYSRYVWAFGIKNKTPNQIEPHIRQIFELLKKNGFTKLYITLDNGGEFKGIVDKLFDEYKCNVQRNDPDASNAKRQTSVVERINQTIWNYMKKYMYHYNTLNYIDYLDDMITQYNNRIHRTTGERPIDILFNSKTSKQTFDPPVFYDLNVDDSVRHLKESKTFGKKSFTNNYSKKVYKIVDFDNTRFLLNNFKYYDGSELLKVDDGAVKSNNFGELLKVAENENKTIRTNQQDFGMKQNEIDAQKIEGKRTRKQTNYFIHNS